MFLDNRNSCDLGFQVLSASHAEFIVQLVSSQKERESEREGEGPK